MFTKKSSERSGEMFQIRRPVTLSTATTARHTGWFLDRTDSELWPTFTPLQLTLLSCSALGPRASAVWSADCAHATDMHMQGSVPAYPWWSSRRVI